MRKRNYSCTIFENMSWEKILFHVFFTSDVNIELILRSWFELSWENWVMILFESAL